MAAANYIKHPNPLYKDNLLVEGMGYPFSKAKVQQKTGIAFEGALDLTDVPSDLHGYYLRSSILNLFSMHVTQDEMVEVYEVIRQAIEIGYLGRNPSSYTQQRILTAIEKDSDTSLKSLHLKRLNLLESSFTYLISGLSGRGKSTMVKQALKLINQRIEHDYTGADEAGNSTKFDHVQITYIYLEHHERAGQKAFLIEILRAVDDAVFEEGEGLEVRRYAYKHRNSDIKDLILSVRKALVKHHVGLLIIDEAQNFSKSSKDMKINTNEKISMRYVEELVNSLGLSTIFVGTFSALELFSKEMTITRRTIKAGSLNLASCPLDSSFWIRLCDALFNSVILPGGQDEQGLLRQKLFELTAGIPAIAVSVVQATLRFLSYFESEVKGLTIDALEYVFGKQFATLSGPISAIINGEYYRYEDTKPMALLEMVDPYAKEPNMENLHHVEKQAQDLVATYNQTSPKMLQGTVQVATPSATNPYEVESVEATQGLSPENLMSIIEGKS